MPDNVSLTGDSGTDGDSLLVEEQRFSIVPEWVIDAALSDAAFRLYVVLLRYGNGSGRRMPSRSTLAVRLHRSTDSVDRAVNELVAAGIVHVERRHNGTTFLSNRYLVRTTDPAAETRRSGGGHKSAATPEASSDGGRKSAATRSRSHAARVAASVRPDREHLTESLLARCGIDDIDALTEQCARRRRSLGPPSARWSAHALSMAIQLAVRGRGWPEPLVVPALLAVAADPATGSPMRLAEAGPWWDAAEAQTAQLSGLDEVDVAACEARLDEVDGRRPALQAIARRELAAEGVPLNRAAVVRRACQVLDRDNGASQHLVASDPERRPVAIAHR